MTLSLCLPAPLPGADSREAELRQRLHDEPNRVILPSAVTIDPIRAVELLPGGAFSIRFNGSQIPPGGTGPILRSLPALWRYDTDSDDAASVAIHASYELLGSDGRPGYLTLVGGDDAILVSLERVDETFHLIAPGRVRVEGGVIFHLDIDDITRSGSYGGVLSVTINHF